MTGEREEERGGCRSGWPLPRGGEKGLKRILPTRLEITFPHLPLLLLLFHDFLAMEGDDLANVAALLEARDNIVMIAAGVSDED